jgi:hypothetical protein
MSTFDMYTAEENRLAAEQKLNQSCVSELL